MCDKNGLIISWVQYSTGLVIVLMLVESCETQQTMIKSIFYTAIPDWPREGFL